MNYRRLGELYREFADKLEELNSFYLDSLAGYTVLHERLQKHQQQMRALLSNHPYGTPEFQDTCSIGYDDLSPTDFPTASLSPVMKQGDVKKRIAGNGNNILTLGSLCVVSAYSYWEEYFRIELGKAVGALPASAKKNKTTREILNRTVKNDFWGDMRHLRNSILKNNGIATSDISKCKSIKWFSPGQKIAFDSEKMLRVFVMMAKFRNGLHSLSLPPSEGIRIPVTE